MPYREQQFVVGGIYHIYNRGCNRERIFFERENYLFFLRRLRRWLLLEPNKHEPEAEHGPPESILAYCLMPNHFHLLVKLGSDRFVRRMQSVCQSYSKAINKRRERVGPLFQSRFRAIEVETEDYLIHLSRYIHLNPVRARLCERPEQWEFSSYSDYVGLRSGTLVAKASVLDLFVDLAEYSRFVEARMEWFEPRIRHLLLDDD